MVQSLPTDDNTNTLYLGACLKWTEKFELETPKTHLYHFTISLCSWTTKNLDLLLFFYQKSLACYRNNQLPVREGECLLRHDELLRFDEQLRLAVTSLRALLVLQGGTFFPNVALSSVQSPQTPAYASTQYSKKFLQAYIFLGRILHIIIIRTWIYINMYRETHRKDSCMKGLGSARRRSWG